MFPQRWPLVAQADLHHSVPSLLPPLLNSSGSKELNPGVEHLQRASTAPDSLLTVPKQDHTRRHAMTTSSSAPALPAVEKLSVSSPAVKCLRWGKEAASR